MPNATDVTINMIASAIQSIVDPIASAVKPILDTVASPIQSIFDSIALLIQTIGQSISAGGFSLIGLSIEPIVDGIAPPVKALINVVSATVEPFIDAIAFPVQTVLDAIAEIGGLDSRKADHEGHADDSPKVSTHLLYLPSMKWNLLPLGNTNAGSQDRLTGEGSTAACRW